MCADTSANRPRPDAAAVRPSPWGTASTRPARLVRRRAPWGGRAITSDTTRVETSFRVFLSQWHGVDPKRQGRRYGLLRRIEEEGQLALTDPRCRADPGPFRPGPPPGRSWSAATRPSQRPPRRSREPCRPPGRSCAAPRSEEHTSELQSHHDLVCRLLL